MSVKNIIIANYSIHSLALINWAKKNLNDNFCVLSVDTGFAADNWHKYLAKVFKWLEENKIAYSHIKAENSFVELVKARKQFPSQQFSWCAGFLKGINLLNKIEQLDPDAKATILLSHRKDLSKVSAMLENIDEEERYDYRFLQYPLLDKSLADVIALTKDLPFKPVSHSLECHPCIYLTRSEFDSVSTKDIKKVIQLEEQTSTFMFGNHHFDKLNGDFFIKKNIINELSKACSWEYSCGL